MAPRRRANEPRTAYTADRAAALAGVPRSTLHYWSRTELVVPSVSPERTKLWSYEDLLAIRTIDWLRRDKPIDRIPPTSMRTIRRALARLRKLDLPLWEEDRGSAVLIDRHGDVYIDHGGTVEDLEGQTELSPDVLDLLAPFGEEGGPQGPDLRAPRPHLRIVPGRLAGEPHVADTRLETRAIAALGARGYSPVEIVRLYPFIARAAIREALELEEQLHANIHAAA